MNKAISLFNRIVRALDILLKARHRSETCRMSQQNEQKSEIWPFHMPDRISVSLIKKSVDFLLQLTWNC